MSTKTTDKIAINSVEIEIAGTKLKLTLEQARELKDVLNKAFPAKEYVATAPVIIEREVWPHYSPNWPLWRTEITCGGSSLIGDRIQGATSGTLCLAVAR